ncbi:MAG: noncanonical pyrimidine nucleotidase, YjjG family [Flavobacterium sp.]|nr:noncanonical pyrimidine nucleotidase, YjjG family [Flavobacterium sp.]
MKHITDIFFDLDHTLWDFEKNSALALAKVFKENEINVNLNEFLIHYVPINMKYWELYRHEQVTQTELRYGRLKDSFDLLGFKIDNDKINAISEQYIQYLPHFNHLFEGTVSILEYLKPNYNLHIITNGFQEVQAGKMKNSGIDIYFKTITNSEMAGVKKPNPKIFELALNLAKVKKENAIMVGDCLDADVNGALNFGIDAIHFNEHKIEIPSHIKQINHLTELKKYF